MQRETDLVFYLSEYRILSELSNEELQLLFNSRAAKIKLDETFWDSDKTLYWNDLIPKLKALYEIMLEIQARYPKKEIEEGDYFFTLLPLNEKQWVEKYLQFNSLSNISFRQDDNEDRMPYKSGPVKYGI